MQEQYIVDGNLNHDGTYLKTGDTVLLTPEQAAPLLAIGRVKKVEQPVAAAPGAPAQDPSQPDGFPAHDPAPASMPAAAPAAPQTPAPATNPSPEQIAQDLEQAA